MQNSGRAGQISENVRQIQKMGEKNRSLMTFFRKNAGAGMKIAEKGRTSPVQSAKIFFRAAGCRYFTVLF